MYKSAYEFPRDLDTIKGHRHVESIVMAFFIVSHLVSFRVHFSLAFLYPAQIYPSFFTFSNLCHCFCHQTLLISFNSLFQMRRNWEAMAEREVSTTKPGSVYWWAISRRIPRVVMWCSQSAGNLVRYDGHILLFFSQISWRPFSPFFFHSFLQREFRELFSSSSRGAQRCLLLSQPGGLAKVIKQLLCFFSQLK